MASVFDTIVADLQAVHTYIRMQQMQRLPQHVLDAVVTSQANQLQARIGNLVGMTVPQATRLSELINEGPWDREPRSVLLEFLATRMAAQPVGRVADGQHANGRRVNQEVRSIHNFVRQDRINVITDESASRVAKVDAMVGVMLDLDLVNPSEKSWGYIIASLVMMAKMPQEPTMMFELVTECKQQLARRRQPVVMSNYVVNLPDAVEGLHVHTLARFGGPNAPANAGISQTDVDTLAKKVPLRKTSKVINHAGDALVLKDKSTARNAVPTQQQMMQVMFQHFIDATSGQKRQKHVDLIYLTGKKDRSASSQESSQDSQSAMTPNVIADASAPERPEIRGIKDSVSDNKASLTPDRMPGSGSSTNQLMTASQQADLMIKKMQARSEHGVNNDDVVTPKRPATRITGKSSGAKSSSAGSKTSAGKGKNKSSDKTPCAMKHTSKKINKDVKRKEVPGWPMSKRMKLYGDGCAKCAWQSAGCTPSCFKARGQV
jgi:hypothetical protein